MEDVDVEGADAGPTRAEQKKTQGKINSLPAALNGG